MAQGAKVRRKLEEKMKRKREKGDHTCTQRTVEQRSNARRVNRHRPDEIPSMGVVLAAEDCKEPAEDDAKEAAGFS